MQDIWPHGGAARFPDQLLVPTRDGDLTCTCTQRDVPFTRRHPEILCDIFTFETTDGRVPSLKLKHALLAAAAPEDRAAAAKKIQSALSEQRVRHEPAEHAWASKKRKREEAEESEKVNAKEAQAAEKVNAKEAKAVEDGRAADADMGVLTAELEKAMQPWTDRAFNGPARTYAVQLNALATALMSVTSLHPGLLEGAGKDTETVLLVRRASILANVYGLLTQGQDFSLATPEDRTRVSDACIAAVKAGTLEGPWRQAVGRCAALDLQRVGKEVIDLSEELRGGDTALHDLLARNADPTNGSVWIAFKYAASLVFFTLGSATPKHVTLSGKVIKNAQGSMVTEIPGVGNEFLGSRTRRGFLSLHVREAKAFDARLDMALRVDTDERLSSSS